MDEKLLKIDIENALKDLSDLIKVNTIYQDDGVKPFGKGVKEGFELLEKIARRDNFEYISHDGYVGEITLGDSGDLIVIAAHIDVVPVSDTWDFPPFSGLIDNSFVYGRGAQDDKGPLVAAYYAMKMLRESNVKINKRFRLLVGGNEERGSSCMHHYFKTLNKEAPVFAFTPDAGFPLIYGEKGIAQIDILLPLPSIVATIKGGSAKNSVAEWCEVELNYILGKKKTFETFLKKHLLKGSYHYKDGKTYIKLLGKSAHGSTPEKGVNAIIKMFQFLQKTTSDQTIKFASNLILRTSGSSLNIKCVGEELKELTANLGTIAVEDDMIVFSYNIRYPECTSKEDILEKISAILPANGEVRLISDNPPLLVDKDNKYIQILLESYKKVSEDVTGEPYTIGGGTYARSIPNCVAFGMEFPYTTSLMHEDNEKLSISELKDGILIYYEALKRINEN